MPDVSTGKLLPTLMSAIAQFERDVIADRICEGLKSARIRGRTESRLKTVLGTLSSSITPSGISLRRLRTDRDKKPTLYRNLPGDDRTK